MIVLDTTTISAMMQPNLNPPVVAWLNRQRAARLHMTTITVMEIRGGIERLPRSNRRRRLEAAFDGVIREALQDRILDFDFDAALAAAELIATRLRKGRPVETRDSQIAGIAVSRGAAIATRNVRHFEDLPVEVIDPWRESS